MSTKPGQLHLPVAENLEVLSLATLSVPLVRTVTSLAILRREPEKVLRIAAGALLAFVVLAVLLVPRCHSLGASTAVASALGVAGIIAYFQYPLTAALKRARFWQHLGIGALSLLWLALPMLSPVYRGALAGLTYVVLLCGGGVFRIEEIRRILRELRSGPQR